MEMLIKETRNENFLRNTRSSIKLSTASSSSNTLITLPTRKKFVKNTSFDQADFERLISHTTNHNKLNNYMTQTNSSLRSDLKLDVESAVEEEDDTLFKKSVQSAKSKSTQKTAKMKAKKSADLTNVTNRDSNTLITFNKKNKKIKKKKSAQIEVVPTIEKTIDLTIKNIINTNDLISTSKSNLFPKVATNQRNNETTNKTKTNNTKTVPNSKLKEEPVVIIQSVLQAATLNESLRWDKRLDNVSEEHKRIELYKINRRKRYIEQRNKFLNLNSNLTRSSNLFSMYEENDYDSESTNNNLDLINADSSTASIYKADLSNAQSNSCNLQTRLLSSDIYSNKMKINKERSNITDSAISSMSSNSR